MPKYDPNQVYGAFLQITRELEAFAQIDKLSIVLDRQGNAFLQGDGFVEPLNANPKMFNEMVEELRNIIARRCPRVPPPGHE